MNQAEIEQAFHRLERGRTGERMRVALTAYTRGASGREAARSVGYADDRTLRRHAKRLGLDALHQQARRARELVELTHEMQQIATRPTGDPLARWVAIDALGERIRKFREQE